MATYFYTILTIVLFIFNMGITYVAQADTKTLEINCRTSDYDTSGDAYFIIEVINRSPDPINIFPDAMEMLDSYELSVADVERNESVPLTRYGADLKRTFGRTVSHAGYRILENETGLLCFDLKRVFDLSLS